MSENDDLWPSWGGLGGRGLDSSTFTVGGLIGSFRDDGFLPLRSCREGGAEGGSSTLTSRSTALAFSLKNRGLMEGDCASV